jgi:hypothetical protein
MEENLANMQDALKKSKTDKSVLMTFMATRLRQLQKDEEDDIARSSLI